MLRMKRVAAALAAAALVLVLVCTAASADEIADVPVNDEVSKSNESNTSVDESSENAKGDGTGPEDDGQSETQHDDINTYAAKEIQTNQIVTGGNTVVASDSEWRFLDDNTDPALGTTIYETYGMNYGWAYGGYYFYQDQFHSVDSYNYDDSAWSVGEAPFGFDHNNNLAVNTELKANVDGSSGGAGIRVPAYFFRTTFELTEADLSGIQSVFYSLRYNDAVIIYINGRSINSEFNTPVRGYSSNLSYGAGESVNGYIEESGSVPSSYLLAGTNTLAVEVHQASADSADIYFDFLELTLKEDEVLTVLDDIKALNVTVGGDETELGFSWYSAAEENARLRISTDKNAGVFDTYTAQTTASEKAPGYYSNKVSVSGLQAGTTYYYRVGGGSQWSELHEITTGDGSNYSFVLAGDPQIGASGNIRSDNYGWAKMIQKVQSSFSDVNFLISAGDQVETASNEDHYDAYLLDELTNLPVATTIGNHDNSANYSEHFNVPNHSALGTTAAGGDYWFTYGDALFMMINAQDASAAEHKEFMQQAIAANQDANWTIAVFHQSVYSGASHSKTEVILDWRKIMVPVVDELNIDIVLMGHDHSYTRTYQMRSFAIAEELTSDGAQVSGGKAVDPEGTLYVTANSASGSKYYALQEEYEYQAIRNQSEEQSITKIDMTGNTFKMVTYILDDNTGDLVVFDQYSITKTGAEQGKPSDRDDQNNDDKQNSDAKSITENNSKTGGKSGNNPKTGDGSTVFIWVILIICAGCIIGGVIIYRKKIRDSHEEI